MRSAPFQRFVVAYSLGRLPFLTRINFLSTRKLSSEKSFENSFGARVSACARSMFSAVIGIWLCLVKFHCDRLSAFRQVLWCLRTMLRRVGKYKIPSVKSNRTVNVYLRSVKFFLFFRNDVPFLSIWFLSEKTKKVTCFSAQKLGKKRTKLTY